LTLLESLIATLLLLTTCVATMQALVAGHVQGEDAWRRARAIELAQALLEEIVRLPYNDPQGAVTFGPESGESNRTLYDNVDDFHNFSESAGSLADATGTALTSDYQGFSRSATVVAATQTVAALGAAFPGVTITVTVRRGTSSTWTVSAFVPQPEAS
jgi:MSHA pilin protein MshD